MKIESFDALTGLEIMERVSDGESLPDAVKAALAVKAAAAADTSHLGRRTEPWLVRGRKAQVRRGSSR